MSLKGFWLLACSLGMGLGCSINAVSSLELIARKERVGEAMSVVFSVIWGWSCIVPKV